MIAAILAIAVIVAIVYVSSIIPYLSTGGSSSAVRGLEILIPIGAAPLVLVLLFLVPARSTLEEIDEEGKVTVVSRPPSREQAVQSERIKRFVVAGSIAGVAAALVLVGLISVGDYFLGFPGGAFYQILALAVFGIANKSMAVSLGLALHLLSGTAIGSVFGFLSATIGPFNIDSIRKGAGFGMLAGFISFSLLFIPVTRFQVEPALSGILQNAGIIPQTLSSMELQNRITDLMSTVLAFSILFHVLYGAVMGSLTSILIDRLPRRRLSSDEVETVRGKPADFS
ncbi:MAG: hypothetical protein ABI361_09370 [Nitrososphaera sp.]|jgi:hypothetical protein